MDLLAGLRIFVRISEAGSFSAVAREVGSTQPAVSRQVAQLEEHFGVRLFQRSTRSLALTTDGRELLAHARQVLEAVEGAEQAIGRRQSAPSGLVRLGCSGTFARLYIAPRIGRLLARYPELSVDIAANDDVVDMVQEGLDLSIRIGEVRDVGLVARRIGATFAATVASADYLEEHGEPGHPADLADHECVIFTRRPEPELWAFDGPEGGATVTVHGRLRTDSTDAVQSAVVAGLGVARLPLWVFGSAVEDGTVRQVLREWKSGLLPIHALYPSRRFLAPRTRVVLDFLIEEFRLDPVISAYGAA